MSIKSNLVQANPEALTLLGILAELPGGVRPDFLPNIAPAINDVGGALVTLHQAALALKEPSTGIIRLLSPIRSFVHDEYPATATDRETIHQAYYALLEKYEAEPGDDIFLEAVQVLTMETVNLETILLEDLSGSPTEDGIRAAYAYTQFQYWTIPRLETMREAIAAARRNGSSQLLAEGLLQMEGILRALNRYDEAVTASTEALEIYRAIGDQSGVADCFVSLGQAYDMLERYDDAVTASLEALKIFHAIDNQSGAANCLVSLSQVYRMLNRYDDAVTAGKEALEIYRALGSQSGAANCLDHLGDAYQMLDRYDDAVMTGTEGLETFRSIGNQSGAANCLVSLSQAYRILDRFDDAVTAATESLEIYRATGDRIGEANSLLGLGRTYWSVDRAEPAVKMTEEALAKFREINQTDMVQECLDALADYGVNPS